MKVMKILKKPCASFGNAPGIDLYLAFDSGVEEEAGKTDEYVLKSDFIKELARVKLQWDDTGPGPFRDLKHHENLVENEYFKEGGKSEAASR
jgi:hypothetical protein